MCDLFRSCSGYRPGAGTGVMLGALVLHTFAFYPSCTLPSFMLLCLGSTVNNWEH